MENLKFPRSGCFGPAEGEPLTRLESPPLPGKISNIEVGVRCVPPGHMLCTAARPCARRGSGPRCACDLSALALACSGGLRGRGVAGGWGRMAPLAMKCSRRNFRIASGREGFSSSEITSHASTGAKRIRTKTANYRISLLCRCGPVFPTIKFVDLARK